MRGGHKGTYGVSQINTEKNNQLVKNIFTTRNWFVADSLIYRILDDPVVKILHLEINKVNLEKHGLKMK